MYDRVLNILLLYMFSRSYLEKNVHLLIEGADELCQDAQKLHNYQRNVVRQQQQIDTYKQRRVKDFIFIYMRLLNWLL